MPVALLVFLAFISRRKDRRGGPDAGCTLDFKGSGADVGCTLDFKGTDADVGCTLDFKGTGADAGCMIVLICHVEASHHTAKARHSTSAPATAGCGQWALPLHARAPHPRI
eukprot:gene5000-biopygen8577